MYVVSWSISFTAAELAADDRDEFVDDDIQDLARRAAIVAHGWLEDAIQNSNGATILVVRDEEGRLIARFDEFGHGRELSRG